MEKVEFIRKHGPVAWETLVRPRQSAIFPRQYSENAATIIDQRITELASNLNMENQGFAEIANEFHNTRIIEPKTWKIMLYDHKLSPVKADDFFNPHFPDGTEILIKDLNQAILKNSSKENNEVTIVDFSLT